MRRDDVEVARRVPRGARTPKATKLAAAHQGDACGNAHPRGVWPWRAWYGRGKGHRLGRAAEKGVGHEDQKRKARSPSRCPDKVRCACGYCACMWYSRPRVALCLGAVVLCRNVAALLPWVSS